MAGKTTGKTNTIINRAAQAIRPVVRQATPPTPRFVWPVAAPSTITGRFGDTRNYPRWPGLQRHEGVDIAPTVRNQPVIAVAAHSGIVEKVGQDPEGYGNFIKIRDASGQLITLYGHLANILVSPGQQVRAGQPIGQVGSTGYSTGPHLHFSVQVPEGQQGFVLPDVIDPLPLLAQPDNRPALTQPPKTGRTRAKRTTPQTGLTPQQGNPPVKPPVGYWPLPTNQPTNYSPISPGLTILEQEISGPSPFIPAPNPERSGGLAQLEQEIGPGTTQILDLNSPLNQVKQYIEDNIAKIVVSIILILLMVLSAFVFLKG